MICNVRNRIHKCKLIAVYGLYTILETKRLWSGLLGHVQN